MIPSDDDIALRRFCVDVSAAIARSAGSFTVGEVIEMAAYFEDYIRNGRKEAKPNE